MYNIICIWIEREREREFKGKREGERNETGFDRV